MALTPTSTNVTIVGDSLVLPSTKVQGVANAVLSSDAPNLGQVNALVETALIGKRIYITVATATYTVTIASYTTGGVAYDPAQTELVLLCTGAAGTTTVTMATDAALVVGASVSVVKSTATSFACNIAAANIQLSSAGNTGTSLAVWTAVASTGLAFRYIYSGVSWCAIGLLGRSNVLDAVALTLFGYSIVGKGTTGAGTATNIACGANQVLGRVGSGDLAFTSTPTVSYVTIANGCTWSSGTGTPEGVVASPIGSLYTNISGGASTTLYVKTSGAGNTGWTAK